MWNNIKYFFKELYYLKVLFSPFKLPKIGFYFGEIDVGVPYFLPRKWRKSKTKPGYSEPIPLKWIGFNYTGLGHKIKWSDTDYRFEWAPMISIVFMKRQFCMILKAPHEMHYWESWLYYNFNTDKNESKVKRIVQCMKGFPNIWTKFNNDTEIEVNYYKLVLRKKYLKYIL